MVALAEQPVESRARIRPSVASDLPYVVETWSRNWHLGRETRRMPLVHYRAVFEDLVVRGVLSLPDTRVVVSCDDDDPDVILGWCCYTPDRVPVVHYALVGRPGARVRQRGIFAVMLATIGVTTRVAYTFHPPDRRHHYDRKRFDMESTLIEAGKRHGITAVHIPVADFLRGT